jgi:signal transduction histidine kinase
VRTRLLIVMVGLVALLLAVHDIPLANHLEQVERDRLTTKYERDAFILAGRVEEALEDGDAATQAELNALVVRYASEEGVEVVVADADGIGVISSDPGKRGEDLTNRAEIVGAIATGDPTSGERFSQTLDADLFFVAVPVLSGNESVGAVRISAADAIVSDRVDSRIRGLLFVALLSLVIASAVAWVFARSVTGPLKRLHTATESLAAGDLTTRAEHDEGPGEVRDLAISFNAMADRLEQLIERQRAFAGTASHQLRTPLTALRLRLEQLAAELDDVPESHAAVESALVETDRLHRMIEGLLALTRAEDAAATPESVDVVPIARHRAEYWSPLAEESEVRIDVVAPPTATVAAVPGAVEQIIDNLVDNALEVSPSGGVLKISVEPDHDGVALHVVDQGPGMSDTDREQAFERFWRGDSPAPGGSGLGLAIVQQLAHASGGTAELRTAPSGGVDAVVRLRSTGAPTERRRRDEIRAT